MSLLILGRAISGLGVGLGVPATAIYVAEVPSENDTNQIKDGLNQGFKSRVKGKTQLCSCSSVGVWCSSWICLW